MFLNEKSFKQVAKNSPIAAIDLCIFNEAKEILLGKRINPPAKSFFFVPGGRIRKGETLFISTKRILNNEMNYEITEKDFNTFSLLGVFQHFYNDNFCGNKQFSSHYVVIVYLVPLKILKKSKFGNFKDQHDEYIWYNKTTHENLLIHPYCKEYFKKL
ncbi:GDP-mannose mannosyl hydrolase [Prochlorococcus marinus]|nr:NUDIX domain-containing protein [Prochlorococcus marinus]